MSWIDSQTLEDFRRARTQALFKSLLDLVCKRSSNLIAFDEVRARVSIRGQRYIGHQIVPVGLIIGSEGRYSDFDRRFLPRRNMMRSRWRSIDKAYHQSVILPPIELYKMGDVYFVKDGNHRVSVACQQGQVDLDAYVTELLVDVPLTPDLHMRDLLLKEEYSDFLSWTGLHQMRPDECIEFTESGGYLDLVRHINAHRYYLGLERKYPVDGAEAVASWYDSVYMPIVHVIRHDDALALFPNRTEADLYRWIMDHRWYLRERIGQDPGPQTATVDYVTHYSRKGFMATLEETLGSLTGILPWFGQRA